MIVDAVDRLGRRYMEAVCRCRPEPCIECGVGIQVGVTYYQRNEASDGIQGGLEGLLTALTYDAVCKSCGETQLRQDAN